MTALAADLQTLQHQSDTKFHGYPIKDNVLIYKGSIVCLDTTGYATVGADTVNFTVAGFAEAHYDNTVAGHAAGALTVNCFSDQIFKNIPIAAAAQTDVGQSVAYVADSGSLTKTPTNFVIAGLIVGYVDATHVDVFVPAPAHYTIPSQVNLTVTNLAAAPIAIPAGGSAAAFVKLSSTAAFGIYFGSGAPTVSAAQGSIYLRSDGSSTSTRLYVNTTGATTWTNFTSAA